MKLLAIVFLWGVIAQAQIKWGVEAKAGITSGGLYGVSSPEWVMESASGLQIGGLLSAQFDNGIAIESGLVYASKNFKHEYSYGGGYYKSDGNYMRRQVFNHHYLEIPVYVGFRLRARHITFVWKAGPYIATALAANVREEQSVYKDSRFLHINKSKYSLSIGNGSNDGLKPFDAGFNFATGLEIKRFTIGFQYSVGFIDILPNPNENYMKQQCFAFSIGGRIL